MKMKLWWRLAALFALLLYALIASAVVLLIVRNLGFALLLGCISVVLLGGAWLVFTGMENAGRRLRGWLLVAFGILGLSVTFIRFWDRASHPRLLIGVLVVGALYLGLLALLRKAYWRERRRRGLSVGHGLSGREVTADFKNPYLIINPKSGNGRATKAHIESLARGHGIKTIVLNKGDDVESLAREATAAGADVLGISGGDGSIGAVVKVALEHDLPVVILPGGTRCHLARDLGLDPSRIADALVGFNGVERKIDVGSINGRIFLNNASFGLYADIVDHPEYRDNKLAVSRKVLGAIVRGEKKPYELRFAYGNREFGHAVQIVVGVNQYQTFKLLELGHRDRLDGGVLQVTAITSLDDAMLRQLVSSVGFQRGSRQQNRAEFYQWTAPSFTISSSDDRLIAGVDGERESYPTPLHIKLMPGALRVYVPAEGERNRPQQVFSFTMLRRIWNTGMRADPGA